MWQATDYPITIAFTKAFERSAIKVFSEAELIQLTNHLAFNPDEGLVIPGTGGLRKTRWPARSQGKRSGARIVYYFRDLNIPLYLLAVYTKGEKIDLTSEEKRTAQKMIGEIVAKHSQRWAGISSIERE